MCLKWGGWLICRDGIPYQIWPRTPSSSSYLFLSIFHELPTYGYAHPWLARSVDSNSPTPNPRFPLRWFSTLSFNRGFIYPSSIIMFILSSCHESTKFTGRQRVRSSIELCWYHCGGWNFAVMVLWQQHLCFAWSWFWWNPTLLNLSRYGFFFLGSKHPKDFGKGHSRGLKFSGKLGSAVLRSSIELDFRFLQLCKIDSTIN